jgi:ssDNA-binding Zn-finger/Zn-ribbon topoisomerase 1
MSINDRMIFTTPDADQMVVEKVAVEGETCPECGGTDVRRYPVGWFKGPRMVVKCQDCYHSLRVERPLPEDNWPPFKTATYDWEASPSERASGVRPPAGGTGT